MGAVQEAPDVLVDKLIALGIISVLDLEEVGVEPLVNELSIDPLMARQLVQAASEAAKAMDAASQAEKELVQQSKRIELPEN